MADIPTERANVVTGSMYKDPERDIKSDLYDEKGDLCANYPYDEGREVIKCKDKSESGTHSDRPWHDIENDITHKVAI